MSANPKLLPTPPSTPFTLAAMSLLSTNVSLFKAQSVETLKAAQPADSEQRFHRRAEMQRNWRLFQVACPQGWAIIRLNNSYPYTLGADTELIQLLSLFQFNFDLLENFRKCPFEDFTIIDE